MTTSVAQRFTLGALDEKVPGSIPGGSIWATNCLDWCWSGHSRCELRCSSTHNRARVVDVIVWYIVIIINAQQSPKLKNFLNLVYTYLQSVTDIF